MHRRGKPLRRRKDRRFVVLCGRTGTPHPERPTRELKRLSPEQNSALDTGEANQEIAGHTIAMQSSNTMRISSTTILGQKQQGDYMHANSLSHASTFDDIMAGLNTASKFATPFLISRNRIRDTRRHTAQPKGIRQWEFLNRRNDPAEHRRTCRWAAELSHAEAR